MKYFRQSQSSSNVTGIKDLYLSVVLRLSSILLVKAENRIGRAFFLLRWDLKR